MYSVRLKLPARLDKSSIEKLSGALYDVAEASVILPKEHKGGNAWVLEWILGRKPDAADLTARIALITTIENIKNIAVSPREWEIKKIANENWLEKTYQRMQPFYVGPFFIHDTHYEGSVPEGQTSLQVEAATAFGSGEHATTKACLQALLHLKDQGLCPWNVLDMGTGSGILAIAAWKLWKTPIMAVDIEAESVRVTKRHMKANGVQESSSAMICAVGNGFHTKGVKARAPFDLIMANILAGPLIEMAEEMKKALDENGTLILSGMLREQTDHVLSVYEALDLTLTKRIDIEEWSTLILRDFPAQDL